MELPQGIHPQEGIMSLRTNEGRAEKRWLRENRDSKFAALRHARANPNRCPLCDHVIDSHGECRRGCARLIGRIKSEREESARQEALAQRRSHKEQRTGVLDRVSNKLKSFFRKVI
jgi:hypothetical protein